MDYTYFPYFKRTPSYHHLTMGLHLGCYEVDSNSEDLASEETSIEQHKLGIKADRETNALPNLKKGSGIR